MIDENTETTQDDSSSDEKPMRHYPEKLKQIDDGKVVKALESLRRDCRRTSPGEIYLVLNPSGITEAAEAQFSQKAHVLEGWRNSLILLPIMVTWISLGLAGLAYTQSIAVDSRLVAEPLLQQWGDGFPILSRVSAWGFNIPLVFGQWRYFSFADVAALDFMLFLLLLFLTMKIHRIEANAAREANELGAWLREECDILREYSKVRPIGRGEGGDTPEWAVLVNDTIENLHVVLADVKTSIRSFDEALKDDRETVSKALAAVDNLNAIYEAGRTTYEKLEATHKELEELLIKMNTSFKAMSDSQRTSVQAFDRVATAVSASSDALVQIAQPFANIGVAQLAQEMFMNLQQAQNQQQAINNALAQQISVLNYMRANPLPVSAYRWWDLRRFFRRSRLGGV